MQAGKYRLGAIAPQFPVSIPMAAETLALFLALYYTGPASEPQGICRERAGSASGSALRLHHRSNAGRNIGVLEI
jgi:hypothetical protein